MGLAGPATFLNSACHLLPCQDSALPGKVKVPPSVGHWGLAVITTESLPFQLSKILMNRG